MIITTAKRHDNALGGVCLYVCLYACISVCNMVTFQSIYVDSSFMVCGDHFYGIIVKFVYEGHLVKVKVTAAKNAKFPIPAM